MTASELATYLNVSPVVTFVSARLFLGEAIRWGQVGGGTLTLIGVYLVTRGRPG
jgi:drug/metabolite transporter (DMT)-like permease